MMERIYNAFSRFLPAILLILPAAAPALDADQTVIDAPDKKPFLSPKTVITNGFLSGASITV